MSETELIEGTTTRTVLGAFFYVYNRLGHGFLESVYKRALAHALGRAGVTVEREHPVTVTFEDVVVGDFRVDLLVDQRVIVEVKAVDRLNGAHEAQLINYLRASGLQVGLLLNFGPSAQHRRLVSTRANRFTPPRIHRTAPA